MRRGKGAVEGAATAEPVNKLTPARREHLRGRRNATKQADSYRLADVVRTLRWRHGQSTARWSRLCSALFDSRFSGGHDGTLRPTTLSQWRDRCEPAPLGR